MPFPSLIPALAAEKIDILATGLTVTEERSQNIDFTIPWWETNDVVLVPEDSDLNVFTAVCCGARVGVQGGSSQQAWMEENVVNSSDIDVELAKYDNYVTAVDDMAIGRISSVIAQRISKGTPGIETSTLPSFSNHRIGAVPTLFCITVLLLGTYA